MQRQHRVVLSLRVPIAGGQCERVIARLNAFGTCDCGIAMFIEYEDVQQRSLRNVRLPSDVRELVFDIGIGDAYGGPVVKELARRRMLGHGFQCGDNFAAQCFVAEFADGSAFKERIDRGVMDKFSHTAIVTRFHG